MGNPAYRHLIEEAPDGVPGCYRCGSRLVSPDNCAKCRGNNAMTTFCPKCDEDCGCEEWS